MCDEETAITHAVNCVSDPNSSNADRLKAHQVLKSFEENAAVNISTLLRLISCESSFSLRQFGLHLFHQYIKCHYSERLLTADARNDMKQQFFLIVKSEKLLDSSESRFIREKYAKCLNEIAKKEFPSAWPTFFADCATLATASLAHCLVVLSFWTRLFEDVIITQNVEPVRRRKGLHNALLEEIEKFLTLPHQILAENLDPKDTLALKVRLDTLEFLALLFEVSPPNAIHDKVQMFDLIFDQLSCENLTLNQMAMQCLSQLTAPKNAKADDYTPMVSSIFSSRNSSRLLSCIKKILTLEIEQQQTYLKTAGCLLTSFATIASCVWDQHIEEALSKDLAGLDMYFRSVLHLLEHPSVVSRECGANSCRCLFKKPEIIRSKLCLGFIEKIILATPSLLRLVGFPSKTEGVFSAYSRLECGTDLEFLNVFCKFRESLISMFRRLIEEHHELAFRVISDFMQNLPDKFDLLSAAEWDAMTRFVSNFIQVISRTDVIDNEEMMKASGIFVQTLLSLLAQKATVDTGPLILSALSAYFPLLKHCPDQVPHLVVQIFRTALWPGFESCEKSRKLRHHAMHEFVHLAVEQTTTLLPFADQIMCEMERRAEELTLRQKCNLAEGFVVLSNEFENYEQQKRAVDYLLRPSVTYFRCDEIKSACSSPQNFAKFVGLCDFTSDIITPNDISFLRRKDFLSHLVMLTGVLFRCRVPNEVQKQIDGCFLVDKNDHKVLHPAFESFQPAVSVLFSIARCLNGFYDSTCVSSFHQAYSGYKVLDLTEVEKSVNMINTLAMLNMEKDDELRTFDHLKHFVADATEKIQILISLIVSKFGWQFFELKQDFFTVGPLAYIEHGLDQRLRFWMRRCFMPIAQNLNMTDRTGILPVFGYFLKHIHERLSARWTVVKNRLTEAADSDSDLTNQEIFVEDVTRLFTKELMIFMKALLCDQQHAAAAKKCNEANGEETGDFKYSEEADNLESAEMHDESESDLKKAGSAEHQPTSLRISLLGIDLLDRQSPCVEDVTLLVFKTLSWIDASAATKACELASLVAKQLFDNSMLDESTTEYLFMCALESLHIHGEHDIPMGCLLKLLSFMVDFLAPHFSCIKRTLVDLPGCSVEKYDAYQAKCKELLENSATQYSLKKLKRDAFKRLVNGIIGKNIGQKFKQHVSYRLRSSELRRRPVKEHKQNDLTDDPGLCHLFCKS